jgi:hypothetical protein
LKSVVPKNVDILDLNAPYKEWVDKSFALELLFIFPRDATSSSVHLVTWYCRKLHTAHCLTRALKPSLVPAPFTIAENARLLRYTQRAAMSYKGHSSTSEKSLCTSVTAHTDLLYLAI